MKITMTVCSVLFALTATSFAARGGECSPLKARNPEGNYVIPGVKGEIVYRRVKSTEFSLDAYLQKRGDRRPGVIVIHGGGWNSGGRVAFVGQFLEMLTRAGYNWFSIDYRLGGVQNYPDAVDDVRAALTFIRGCAKEFRIDPDRIALFGEDTGAHLAAMLASEKPAGVKATVLIGGMYDLREIPSLKSQHPAELLGEASPVNHLSKEIPPALIVHGTADRESSPAQAVRYCEAMREVGGRCHYFPVDGAIHRPENWTPTQWGYKEAALSWLGRELGLARPDHEPYRTNLKKDLVFSQRHKLKLDAFIPRGRGPFPAVIIAHGGGWEAGDKVTYVTPLFEPLARSGFAWFSIDYRLTPSVRHPDQLEDLREAIRYVRDNARSFRIDPHRIALLGESASGQMVTQFATKGFPGLKAVVSFYGVYNFSDLVTDVSPRSIPARLFGLTKLDAEAEAMMRRYSPIHNVRTGMAPVLLIHGVNERLYAQGVAMAKKLAESYVDYEFYEIRGAPHGLENWEGHPEWMKYKTILVDWLKRKLSR
jgi:alpha-L-fucosidase 2